MRLQLPFPPSVNNYWGFHGHRRFLTPKAKEFKSLVLEAFRSSGEPSLGSSRLHVSIDLHPNDRRRTDIDNRVKSCLDALVQAGAFDDDSQIDLLTVRRCAVGGFCVVVVEPLTS